jgi:hypothetical protein
MTGSHTQVDEKPESEPGSVSDQNSKFGNSGDGGPLISNCVGIMVPICVPAPTHASFKIQVRAVANSHNDVTTSVDSCAQPFSLAVD